MDKKQFVTMFTGVKSAYPASKILEDTESMDFWLRYQDGEFTRTGIYAAQLINEIAKAKKKQG